jgi:hypothetical protein
MTSQRQQARARAAARCGSALWAMRRIAGVLTRDRVAAEALAIISASGAAALSMRRCAAARSGRGRRKPP